MSKEYGDFTKEQRYRIIEESLLLLSTYFGRDTDPLIHKSQLFLGSLNISNIDSLDYIKTRFFLAKWVSFKAIIGTLDSIFSSTYEPIREEFVGKIQGSLIVSEYVSNKWNNATLKNYPCLISAENYETPENAFLYKVIYWFYNILKKLPLPNESGEFVLQKRFLQECANMLHHPVMMVIVKSKYMKINLNQLISMTQSRNKQGKTKDYKKISNIILWFKSLHWTSIENEGIDNLVLLFGSSSKVWDKLFEIWVLSMMINSIFNKGLEKHNLKKVVFPLDQRGRESVTRIVTDDCEINIYYQNSSLVQSLWKYEDGANFRGIPDLLINVQGISNFTVICDVKNVKYFQRKDANTEKYKMLGYFENFRNSLNHQPIGQLFLRNDTEYLNDRLITNDKASLSLRTVSPNNMSYGFDDFSIDFWNLIEDNSLVGLKNVLETDINEISIINRSDEAHRLAEQLVTEKPQELKKCKNNLKNYIFPSTWSYFSKECQTLLGMAELLFQDLNEKCGEDPDVDWGPVVLEYCRAVEYFFNHEIMIPFKESSLFNVYLTSSSKTDTKSYEYIKNKRTLMFGELAHFFKTTDKKNGGIYNYLLGISHYSQDINFWGDELGISLESINRKYRRKAAHIDLLTIKQVSDCRLKIIGSGDSKGLLPMLFEKI